MASTILVDPEGSSQSGEQLAPPKDFHRKTTLEHLAEPLDPHGTPYELEGRPCLLFADWDYAEDWSGEHVREVHPFAVLAGKKISEERWRELVTGLSTRASP